MYVSQLQVKSVQKVTAKIDNINGTFPAGLPDAMLRSLVIGELGRYGHTDTIAEAQRRFSDHCLGQHLLPADIKVAVFSTCLANGDKSTYDQLVKVMRHWDCG